MRTPKEETRGLSALRDRKPGKSGFAEAPKSSGKESYGPCLTPKCPYCGCVMTWNENVEKWTCHGVHSHNAYTSEHYMIVNQSSPTKTRDEK